MELVARTVVNMNALTKRLTWRAGVCGIVVLFAGCASGYGQFYQEVPGATPDTVAKLRAAPPPVVPMIERSSTAPDPDIYARRGYAPIGYSSFNSARSESEDAALEQGQRVGADLVVVVNPLFTNSVTSQVPITTPTSSTSYTTGTATAYGAQGPVTAYGSSRTTTYGSQTNYIPVTSNRYDYGAVFFVKRAYILGANWRDLTDAERSALQSNSGVAVASVVEGTPAFRGDILAGDVILKIDGQPIYGQQAASDLIGAARGRNSILTISRGGTIIEKSIPLEK